MGFILIKQYVFTAYKYQVSPLPAQEANVFHHTTSSAQLHPDLRALLVRTRASPLSTPVNPGPLH